MTKGNGNGLWNTMAFFYELIFERFPPYQKMLQEIVDHCNKSPGSSNAFLDAGCGTGLISVELARKGYPVVGIDRSPSMLKKALKKKERENLPNLHFVEGDLDNFNLHKYPFNKILFIHSFYLLKEPRLALERLSSCLAPGSEVVMCNPGRKLTTWELCKGGMAFFREGLRAKSVSSIFVFLFIAPIMGALNVIIQRRKKRTYHCWTLEEIASLLNNCGFKIMWCHESCLANSHFLLSAVKEG